MSTRNIFISYLNFVEQSETGMQYDWSGVRTRRMKALKMFVFLIASMFAALAPLVLLAYLHR